MGYIYLPSRRRGDTDVTGAPKRRQGLRVHPEAVGRGCRAATTPPAYSGRTGTAARFVPCLNGAGTPQRGVRYLLQQLQEARGPSGTRICI